jgi:hypothetical protein
MSMFSSLANKITGAALRTETGKAIVQKSALSWVTAFLRGDNFDDQYGDRLVLPFKNSVWVQRAIKRVAEPIAAVPLDFYELAADGKETEITDPALTAFWEAPGIDRSGPMDRADFIEATVGWLKLSGEAFWILDDSWLTQRFTPATTGRAPMIVARPDRMEPVMVDNKLTGWIFTDAGGQRHPLVKDQVVHRKFWNPYDDIRGLAEYASARVASEADYLAGKFSLNVNRANGDRGVFVTAKGGVPTDEQQEQITRVLREKANAARRGDFRPVFLSGDVAIEDPKVSSPDADFVAARLQNRHEIFIAFGVPPSMADIVASYSVGSASDRYLLIQETCIPLGNGKISGAIEAVSRLFFTGRTAPVRAKFDFDDHPVMQQVRRERLDSLDKLWDKGMPVREANDYLGLGLPEYPGWEIGYLPFNVGPASEAGLPAPLPGETAPSEVSDQQSEVSEPSIEETFARRNDPMRLLEHALACRAHSVDSVKKSDRDPRRVALANSHLAQRKPLIKAFMSKFTAQLMIARRETLSKIAKGEKSGGVEAAVSAANQRAAASDFLFNLNAFKQGILASMRNVANAGLDTAGQELWNEIGFEQDDPFTMPPPAAIEYLHSRENRLSNVSDEVYDRIKTQLEEGLREGESMSKLADRIKSEFNDIGKGDAMRMASTETSSVYGVARQEAMKEAGVAYKQWLTSGLPNVRPFHRLAENQTVAVDEPFVVGGENLMHPGDPRGSAGNVINCHCVSIAVASKGASA